MADEFGTRDVFEQIETLLANVEQDLRGFRTETTDELRSFRDDVNRRFDRVHDSLASQHRWYIGVVMSGWVVVIASMWLKQ